MRLTWIAHIATPIKTFGRDSPSEARPFADYVRAGHSSRDETISAVLFEVTQEFQCVLGYRPRLGKRNLLGHIRPVSSLVPGPTTLLTTLAARARSSVHSICRRRRARFLVCFCFPRFSPLSTVPAKHLALQERQ